MEEGGLSETRPSGGASTERVEAKERPRLALVEGGNVVRVFEVRSDGLTIGRLRSCSIALSDERVSKIHASVHYDGDEVVIEDMGSRNGTRVNERKVRSQTLHPGDLVRVGRTSFIFFSPAEPAGRGPRWASGWIVARWPDKRIRLPVTEIAILIGRADEADIRVKGEGITDITAQIIAVPTGAQVTDLRKNPPLCSMLTEGRSMAFGPLVVEYTSAEDPDAMPTGIANVGPVEEPDLSEVVALPGRRTDGDDLIRALEEEAEHAESSPAAAEHNEKAAKGVPLHRIGGCKLTATAGPCEGNTYTLAGQPLVIGRQIGCDIRLDDPRVSRRHARIFRMEGDIVIDDLNSANGVFVNGRRIRRQPLKPGDIIRIGSSTFLVHI